MISRSSEDVWRNVGRQVLTFAEKWHIKGTVDRAVGFMIDTGRCEFSEYIWPLISNESDEIHLRALRAGRRFKPNVLGPGVQERLSSLPERQREDIISEIAQESGMDGIELATMLAKQDPSPQVKIATLESLVFRRAHRFVAEILSTASDDVWRSLARKWAPEDFGDSGVAQRISREADALLATQENPRQAIWALLHGQLSNPDLGKRLRGQIERIDFSRKDQSDTAIVHRAYERFPDDVVAALVDHLVKGSVLPHGFEDLLRESSVSLDAGPVVERVLASNANDRNAEVAITVVGPTTIGRLMDRLIEIDSTLKASRAAKGPHDKRLSDEYHHLLGLIANSKVKSFAAAILERSQADDPSRIAVLADLISRHGRGERRPLSSLDSKMHEELTRIVKRWGEMLFNSSAATREQMAEIPGAAERLRSPALLSVLRDLQAKDQALWESARQERTAAHARGQRLDNDAGMSWKLQYQRGFAAIGDTETIELMKSYLPDPQFGLEAAHVLNDVWSRSQPSNSEERLAPSWPDFSVVGERSRARQSGEGIQTPALVDDILNVVAALIRSGASETLRHALRLATVAFGMPHAGKESAITRLLELDLPVAEKQNLLTVLAISGITIPSDLVLKGVDEFLARARTERWLLEDQDGHHLNTWLRLLPFTERPQSVLDVLDRLEDRHKIPWRLRGLLSALGDAPSQTAEDVLLELARRDGRLLDEHEWWEALTKRNTPSVGKALLDLVCIGYIPGPKREIQPSDVARKLAALLRVHPSFREEVYARFQRISGTRAKDIVERAIVDAPDKHGVLLLIRDAATTHKDFDATGLYSALRHVLVAERPSMSWSGAQELYGLPAADLRKQLFHMAIKNDEEGRLAATCLAAIDEIRDDYGGDETEPRHPDITLGRPWPLIDL